MIYKYEESLLKELKLKDLWFSNNDILFLWLEHLCIHN